MSYFRRIVVDDIRVVRMMCGVVLVVGLRRIKGRQRDHLGHDREGERFSFFELRDIRQGNPFLTGAVKIVSLKSSTSSSLGSSTGTTRVAWTVIGTLPVVQCVEVRRTGNFITGIDVSLLRITPPIPNEGEC